MKRGEVTSEMDLEKNRGSSSRKAQWTSYMRFYHFPLKLLQNCFPSLKVFDFGLRLPCEKDASLPYKLLLDGSGKTKKPQMRIGSWT